VLLQEQPAVVLLLERVLVSWSLDMDEHGGHEDSRGSDRQSVIPYVHGRTELYCSSLLCLSLPIYPPPVKRCMPVFYSLRLDNYIETRGPTGGPEVIETIYIM
jgi:hypothetical protein